MRSGNYDSVIAENLFELGHVIPAARIKLVLDLDEYDRPA
jgi:hypothetical protein